MAIIIAMTERSRSSKILLVAGRRSDSDTSDTTTIVRRYRLARVRFDARPAGTQAALEQSKRLNG
jgi:hypothetical protein